MYGVNELNESTLHVWRIFEILNCIVIKADNRENKISLNEF